MSLPVFLYTRPDCALCDELVEGLEGLPLDWTHLDVDSNREWKKQYGLRIPVLCDADGEVLVEGRLDGAGLARVRARVRARLEEERV